MQIYNSLTNRKEKLIPIKPKKITIYVCGITPYDTTHLGHAFTYISFDVLIKYLKYKGFDISYTQNVTDINDRDNDILKRAQELNTTWQELADYWTKRFLDDMEKLNWTKPNYYLFASEQILVILKLIQQLLDKKFAYKKNGSIYFDITKDKNYGKLSKLSERDMLKTAESFDEDLDNPDKKHPLDITLWRSSTLDQPKHIPSFDSPFGKGRPGWHIECSVMSMEYLGNQIDIHGGGVDLIYPHHESEITQSENASGKVPFVKYWMHTGAVYYKGEKMSKSSGNLIMVSKLLEKYSANAIRWVLLSHHWHQDWEFNEVELNQAEKKLEIINQELKNKVTNKGDQKIINEFERAMEDNLNTQKVLETIFQAAKNKTQQTQTIKLMLNTLGFKF